MFSAPGGNASPLASRSAWSDRSRSIPITSRSRLPSCLSVLPEPPRRVPPIHAHEGRRLAERLIDELPSCTVSEIARRRRLCADGGLAYFDTDGANKGGTEGINGLVESGRSIAKGSATSSTTVSGCYSSPAASTLHLTYNSEEPDSDSWLDCALGPDRRL